MPDVETRSSRAPLHQILGDRESGSWEIERRLLKAFLKLESAEPELDLADVLDDVSIRVLENYLSMANLLRLINRLWLIWEKPGREDHRRQQLRRELTRRLVTLERRVASVGRYFLDYLADRRLVLTLSRSGTVLQALTFAHGMGKRLQVVVSEGRPRCEGTSVADELHRLGVPVWLCIDSALPAILNGTRTLPLPEGFDARDMLVVVGADSINPDSFVNKVGTHVLSLVAQRAAVPVVLLATEDKLLPSELSGLTSLGQSDPSELGAPDYLPVINFGFEATPFELLTAGIFETGVFTPGEIREKIRGLEICRYLGQRVESAARGG